MKRNEACRLLTNFATCEFIDRGISREILKARDIVVCQPNKILEVLATDETRKRFLRILEIYIQRITSTYLLDGDIEKGLLEVNSCLHDGFENECDGYLPMRCRSCPKYKGD